MWPWLTCRPVGEVEAGAELGAESGEVLFGDGGDGALEARDDGLDLGLLPRLDLLDGFGHLFGRGAAGEAAEA